MKLYYVNGLTSEVTITKEGKKYVYFTDTSRNCCNRYRCIKDTGEVQIAPYWNTEKRMRVEF